MKTIGLIGGMSWESTDLYYQKINRLIQDELGGLHSAKIILYSVNFDLIATFQREDRWEEAGEYLSEIAYKLELAGADVIGLCTNTMHKVASYIENRISIPFIYIADATSKKIQQDGLTQIALLGTAFTMGEDFYRLKFTQDQIMLLIPNADNQKHVHQIIFDELCKGVVTADSKRLFLKIIAQLVTDGAQGVILGCTEIGMLIHQKDLTIPVFDTTDLHVSALVDFVLNI